MLVMGIETSTMQGGVALVSGQGVVCEYTLNVKATYSERLLPLIDRALQDAGMTLGHVEGFAVAIGPGSFTGLRIGLSTAKGLAVAGAVGSVRIQLGRSSSYLGLTHSSQRKLPNYPKQRFDVPTASAMV